MILPFNFVRKNTRKEGNTMEGIILDASTKTDYEQALIDQEENQELSKDAIGREVMRRALEKINWTESQQKELEELYSFSVTQDFGDTYHMTEEERQAIYNLEEPIKRFKQKYSRKIRKVDKYVEAVRGWWEVVVFYSENNAPFMDPEKFRMDVVKGDIIINNLYLLKCFNRSSNLFSNFAFFSCIIKS